MGLLNSISQAVSLVKGSEGPVTAGMGFWDVKNEKPFSDPQAFQYFPERINDSKSVDYASKSIPGGSHPVYSFVGGGERSISFEAILQNDYNLTDVLSGAKIRKDVVNIPEAIEFFRSALYPIYKNNVMKAPPPVILYLPNSGIISSSGIPNSLIGILTSANIVYEAFYRDGTPRSVVVSVEIKEICQTSEHWNFQGRDSFEYHDDNGNPTYKRNMVGLPQGSNSPIQNAGVSILKRFTV